MERGFYVLAYDISCDKRRAKVAKLLESTGNRVQGSVFEAWFTQNELERVVIRSQKILLEKEDSLRIYFICEECRAKIQMKGTGKVTEKPGLVIV
ncbi:MAG: CRISPR-associated endonuclease Cas2 [Leptolinea sp.]|jgi:CRISPR-associated protein Cas2|nr:CRISPR-associated endonuclease Cas2 [Leptolinea sp.]